MAYDVICSNYSRIHQLFSEPQYLPSSHSRLRNKAQTHSQLRPRSNPLNFPRPHLRLPGISKHPLILRLPTPSLFVRAVPEAISDLSVPKNNILYHFSCSVFTCVLPEDPEVDLSLKTHSEMIP